MPNNKIKQFKAVAKNYDKYLNRIKELDDKIFLIQHKMENIHSIDFDKQTGNTYFEERSIIDLIEKKTSLENEQDYYRNLIKWVDGVVNSFDSGALKAFIWMSCVKNRSLKSIAAEYNISKDYLYKVRIEYLNNALNDKMIDELRLLLNSAPVCEEFQ